MNILFATCIFPAKDRNLLFQLNNFSLSRLRNHFHMSERETPIPNGMPKYLVISPCLICLHSLGIHSGICSEWVIINSVLLWANWELETSQYNSNISSTLFSSASKFCKNNMLSSAKWELITNWFWGMDIPLMRFKWFAPWRRYPKASAVRTYKKGDKEQPCLMDRYNSNGVVKELLITIWALASWNNILTCFCNLGPKPNEWSILRMKSQWILS